MREVDTPGPDGSQTTNTDRRWVGATYLRLAGKAGVLPRSYPPPGSAEGRRVTPSVRPHRCGPTRRCAGSSRLIRRAASRSGRRPSPTTSPTGWEGRPSSLTANGARGASTHYGLSLTHSRRRGLLEDVRHDLKMHVFEPAPTERAIEFSCCTNVQKSTCGCRKIPFALSEQPQPVAGNIGLGTLIPWVVTAARNSPPTSVHHKRSRNSGVPARRAVVISGRNSAPAQDVSPVGWDS